ncbi:efflux RND transporter periplasmic adaptor subunit [Sphingobium sp. DEHP117]|uniref:efflux RND transporter periplasmic adaptor subunit n=1 Tax=Sphingobium sp. DEHP117 TaxID=2993436 RepID=UPI0027D5F462|nr:efflux RND transporter periplasmic adaptor subunit [Sphingobium sp. DEHP117]MDQ4419493.1 efflux RND transporter periplasmic adaptor subunit [Sphingobium sp. DEHP117]
MGETLRRWRWALAIVAVLAAGLAYAFWPQRTLVDAATITRGRMAVGITDDGVTRAKELYVVSAPVTGYLSRIDLEVGDRVTRGTVVTRMSGRPSTPLDLRSQRELRAALAAARANESALAASLAQARRDLARAEEIAGRGFLPRSQLEAARTRVTITRASLAQSRAEIARIQAQVAPPTGADAGAAIPVRAPATGSVLSVVNESAGVIPEGTPLMAIGDPRQIEVVVDLLSREAVRAKPGDRVEITQWGGEMPLTGRVERIEPFGRLKVSALGIEEQRVNLIIAFDAASLPRATRLGHGYQLDATILLWSKPDAIRVPIGALFRDAGGAWHVFVIDRGRARERAIRIGHINDEFGEVLGGLAEGESVILNPGSTMADGARVKPR